MNTYKIPKVLAFLNVSVANNYTLEYFPKSGKTSLVKTPLGVLKENNKMDSMKTSFLNKHQIIFHFEYKNMVDVVYLKSRMYIGKLIFWSLTNIF